ncbi:MAG: helix-turn-helix domain-containing protein [Deltaproteobacteria bacterium]|nr:helix-turn-helix domain-containing protein [Deltaproteobacteria bacterium]
MSEERSIDTPWLSFQDACRYLSISRQTLSRLIASGRLVPDGRIARRWRFHRLSLDAFVRGTIEDTSELGRPARKEVGHADQAEGDDAHAHSGDSSGWAESIPGARPMDRSKDWKEKEERSDRGKPQRGRGAQGEPQARGAPKSRGLEDAIRRIRRAMGNDQRRPPRDLDP